MKLLKALRRVSRIESSPIREAVFQDIAGRSVIIRGVVQVHGLCRRIGISHWMVAAYGFSHYLRASLPEKDARWLGIASFPNELRQLDDLDAVMGPGWEAARVRWRWNMQGLPALSWKDMKRILRLVRHIDSTHRFMPACRITAALFLYVRLRSWLEAHKPRAIVVTSDYAPDAVALSAAAAQAGIVRLYVPHALPSLKIAGRVLDFDLYLFDSEAMHSRFHSMSPITGKVIYRGVRGMHRDMLLGGLQSGKPRIGIFLSGGADVNALRNTILGIARLSPQVVLVRGHPVDFANPDFSQLHRISPLVKVSEGTTLEQDTKACDVIIAGNTTAILECLRMGVPTVYLGALDHIPHDYNGFVADGLVPEIHDASELDPVAVAAFYSEEWLQRMRYFDAAYGVDARVVKRQVRDHIIAWLEGLG